MSYGVNDLVPAEADEAAHGSPSPYLQIANLSLAFPCSGHDVDVLNGVGFDMQEGEVVSLLGPSGCGKTTLLNVISGLRVPEAGTLNLQGTDVIGSRLHSAYMFQDHGLLPWRSVIRNVLLPAELEPEYKSRRERARFQKRALGLLKAFGLEHAVEQFPAQLSGGMKQRAALARTFMADRPIYLFDEPFTGLDLFRRLQVEKMLSDFIREHRKTCLLITHDVETALAISDRILLLSGPPCTIRKEIRGLAAVSRDPIAARQRPEFEEALRQATVILGEIFASL
jgi:ABC-type nitrate/sulfonate/bicarbonate transport system ATPase subunit